MMIDTISTQYNHGIKLDTGNYGADLTITNTGVVNSTSFGIYANLADTSLNNEGSIHAGIGIDFTSNSTGGVIVNTGSIYGSTIAAGLLANNTMLNYGVVAGGSSYGVVITGGGTFENEGTIITPRLGVGLLSGSVTNSGTIHGSKYGLDLQGGSVLNSGTIYGTTIGISVSGGSFTNLSGVISSNLIGAEVFDDAAEPYAMVSTGTIEGNLTGLFLASAAMKNEGLISSETTGVALYVNSTLYNTGTITGGTYGIYFERGTLTNLGTISGGSYAIDGYDIFSLNVYTGSVIDGKVHDQSNTGTLRLFGNGAENTLSGIGSQFTGFSNLDFTAKSLWTLEGDEAGLTAGQTISGFAAGDTIVLDRFAATSETYVSGIGLILANATASETIGIVSTFTSDEFILASDGTDTEITAPCFAAGTRIATAFGKVPVESLKIGDLVQTRQNGLRPIKWIGTRIYSGAACAGQALLLPIHIRRHAIAFNVPARDLTVSPDHAICIGNALIPAWRLINGISITQAERVDFISYFHIELASHDILFAENCPAESFLDAACRDRFQNAAEYKNLYPALPETQSPCLPRLEHGFQLEDLKRRIEDRAGIKPQPLPPGPLRGAIDEANPGLLRGWVQDVSKPEQPVSLILSQRGMPTARLLANRYRPDLRKAGIGSGCHAFEIAFPEKLNGEVELRRASDGALFRKEGFFL